LVPVGAGLGLGFRQTQETTATTQYFRQLPQMGAAAEVALLALTQATAGREEARILGGWLDLETPLPQAHLKETMAALGRLLPLVLGAAGAGQVQSVEP
jgi:hypothetical protein